MKKQVWASVVALVAVTVLVVVAAVWLLRPTESGQSTNAIGDSADSVQKETVQKETVQKEAAVQKRPDCPGPSVGGVDLPCLGGGNGGKAGGTSRDEASSERDDASPERDDASPVAADHITVVNVWAWWCEPCRAELPALDEFAREHPEYTVVGVHADTNAVNGAALLNDLGLELPSYQDSENAFAGTLGLPGVVPVTVIFRGEEKVGVLGRGFSSSSEIARAVGEVL